MSPPRTAARWVIISTVIGFGVIGLGLNAISGLGVAARAEGIPAVALVRHAADGSCLVGVKRQHCYRLTFEVLPEGEPSFVTHLDVNVPDRWATRVQAGSYVWIVRDREAPTDVKLAVEAFSEPPPVAPRVAP